MLEYRSNLGTYAHFFFGFAKLRDGPNFLLLIWIQFVQEAPSIEVYQVERNGYVEIWARNPHIYPVTIELSAELENLSSDKSIPMTDVLKPKSNRKLVRLDPISPRDAWNFDTRFATYKGDVFAIHQDNFAYQFPYRRGVLTMYLRHFLGSSRTMEVLLILSILPCQ